MKGRLIAWAVVGVVLAFASHLTIPAPGGAIDMAASGHAPAFWVGFVVILTADIAWARRAGRTTTAPAGPVVEVTAPTAEEAKA